MRLFEYQAKSIFERAGIAVPASTLVRSDREPDFSVAVGTAASGLLTGQSKVVLKAQLLMGGRGKAGLIKLAATPDEAAEIATEFHTGRYGVQAILVEQAVDSDTELYLSITADPQPATYVVLASTEGGVDIEELARTRADAVTRLSIDVHRGLQAYQARGLAYELGLSGDLVRRFVSVLTRLYGVFVGNDAELAEINPLFLTRGGDLVAGDGKLVIDDNSLFRHEEFERTREYFDSDAEFEAAAEGIPYLQFDGDISLMCAGAGLTTTVFDLVHDEGGTVSNYLEFGGPNYRKAKRALELCLKNTSKVILIVTFGTIARADVMAEGVVEAIAALKPDRPIVTCIRGTNEEAATETLKRAGLEPLFDTEQAVRHAVAIAAGTTGSGAVAAGNPGVVTPGAAGAPGATTAPGSGGAS